MGKFSRLPLVFGMLLVLCAPALAAQERLTITPFTGWVFGGTANTRDGRLHIKETADYGVNVDLPYRGGRTTWMRFSFSTYDTTVEEKADLTGVSRDLFDMRVDHYQLGGTKVINEGRIQTYGMGTFGVTHFSPRDSSYSSETRFSMHFGLGMEVMFSKYLGLNLQGRLLLPFNYYSGSLFCGSSGCNLVVSGASSLMQVDMTAGLVMRF
ncbi:MAG TPA: hypothetical protein ENI94_05160 [Gammaproteobacteria bacterium]|nr:hypothetical protein [Gammaproteobacteria bacterium]